MRRRSTQKLQGFNAKHVPRQLSFDHLWREGKTVAEGSWVTEVMGDTARRNRLFSCSDCFKRRTWSRFTPPYPVRQR